MWWMDGGFHWGWMLVGGLMMLVFWGGLIALAIVIIRSFAGGKSGSGQAGPPSDKPALQILEERYARGEISKKEFEAIRADLSG
jgi:putative membrane protein